VIQLAAFRSDEKANEIASLLSEKHSSRLQGVRLQTMRLDTGSNGVFFRVVSTPMSRAEAENTCTKLRRAGQDCFLRKFVAPEG
jgi:cell division septation protein DedD